MITAEAFEALSDDEKSEWTLKLTEQVGPLLNGHPTPLVVSVLTVLLGDVLAAYEPENVAPVLEAIVRGSVRFAGKVRAIKVPDSDTQH